MTEMNVDSLSQAAGYGELDRVVELLEQGINRPTLGIVGCQFVEAASQLERMSEHSRGLRCKCYDLI